MRVHFSHRLAYSIASVAFVSAAMSSVSPCYASAAQTDPTTLVQRTQVASTPAVVDKEPAGNIVKKEENDRSITYTRTKDVAVKNPFPSMISDEEIAEAFKRKGSIQKKFFTPDSDATQKPMLIDGNVLKDEPGTYTIYTVVNKYAIPNLPYSMFVLGYQTRNGFALKDGSIYAGSDKTVTYTMRPYSFELNGCELAKNATKQTLVEMESHNYALYYKITCHIDGSDNERVLTFFGDKTTSGTSTLGGEGQRFSYDKAPLVSAQFHFVDDFAYRAQTHQTDDVALKQRGNTDEHPLLTEADKQKGFVISAVPNHKIDGLEDLTNPVETERAYFMRNTSNDVKYPILSYKDDPDAPKTENGTTSGRFRPTLQQLTSTDVPGYVYWDNDIDKPKGGVFQNNAATKDDPGNHYLSFAYEMKDGKPVKRLDTKYYYVTFRKIPTQLVVHQFKKNPQTQAIMPLITGSFDLYQRVGNNDVLIKKNITLSKDFSKDTAPARESVVSAMKAKNALQKEGFYQVQDKLYLQPGLYVLRQSQAGDDAPKIEDMPFTVSWQLKEGEKSDLVKEPSTIKILEIDRDKIKLVPPTPTPQPNPLPHPKPAPVPPAPEPQQPEPVPQQPVPPAMPAPTTPAKTGLPPALTPGVTPGSEHGTRVPTNDTPKHQPPQQPAQGTSASADALPHTADALAAPFVALTTASLACVAVMIAALKLRLRKRR